MANNQPQPAPADALNDLDAERSVLGSILLDPRVLPKIRALLSSEDFYYLGRHGEIFQAMLALDEHSAPINNVSIAHELRRRGSLDKVGGRTELASLQSFSATAANAEHDARIVLEFARKRQLLRASHQLARLASDPSISADDAGQQALALIARTDRLPAEAIEPEIGWPAPMSEAAWYGLAGDIVREIAPTSEADPVALLAHVLTYFGNAAGIQAGRLGPHVMVEETAHGPNEFFCLVGATSKARKGTAERRIRKLFQAVDEGWTKRIRSGLSSGEGLIWNVRDAIVKDGKTEDPGEPDKRLLVVESELAVVLRRIEHEGSSLSPILRDAWDRMPLNTLVSERSRAAVGALSHHISVLGHITRTELIRYLTRTEMANGLGNRFLFALVKRSKYLPRGARPPSMPDLVMRLHDALKHACTLTELDFDAKAEGLWVAIYPPLSDAKPGLAGEMLARGEAHVLRLALIYALLDCDTAIRTAHLLAALAVWTYCEDSVLCMFAAQLGDPDADAVLDQLRRQDQGLTTSGLRDAFGHNWPSERIRAALKTLIEHGMAEQSTVRTGGRPATHYRALAGTGMRMHTYMEYAVNALNAKSQESSSKEAQSFRREGTPKVFDSREGTDLSRSSSVLTAYQAPELLNSDLTFSRLPRDTAYRASVREEDESVDGVHDLASDQLDEVYLDAIEEPGPVPIFEPSE